MSRARPAPDPALPADEELVALTRAGDRDAYAVLVRRYQDGLYRYALGMRLDHDAACDLVQDAFVRGFSSLPRLQDPASFGTWLFRILRNRVLDHLKSPRRNRVPVEEQPLEAETEDPLRGVELDELRGALVRALDALPRAQREAFLLKHRDGRSYDEIAAIMEASVSAVKMRVHRAREALQVLLGETDGARSM